MAAAWTAERVGTDCACVDQPATRNTRGRRHSTRAAAADRQASSTATDAMTEETRWSGVGRHLAETRRVHGHLLLAAELLPPFTPQLTYDATNIPKALNGNFFQECFLLSPPSLSFLSFPLPSFPFPLSFFRNGPSDPAKILRGALLTSSARENDSCRHQTCSLSFKYTTRKCVRPQTHFWCV